MHCLPGKSNTYVESFYAHLDKIKVKEGAWLQRGDMLGTICTADGAYIAHLHFELRHKIDMLIGPGYSTDTTGYLDPTKFIIGTGLRKVIKAGLNNTLRRFTIPQWWNFPFLIIS